MNSVSSGFSLLDHSSSSCVLAIQVAPSNIPRHPSLPCYRVSRILFRVFLLILFLVEHKSLHDSGPTFPLGWAYHTLLSPHPSVWPDPLSATLVDLSSFLDHQFPHILGFFPGLLSLLLLCILADRSWLHSFKSCVDVDGCSAYISGSCFFESKTWFELRLHYSEIVCLERGPDC